MTIIFGVLKERSASVSEVELHHLASLTSRYATGAGSTHVHGRLGMGFQPYASHQRSVMETRPVADGQGNVLSFDGRLDNCTELAKILEVDSQEVSDSQLVLGAFERWGDECFSHLLGDWALALWCESSQSLYLARDHAGTRTLYFSHDSGEVLWSTHLDTFCRSGSNLPLADNYVARYLTSSPILHLTPYQGVHSVPAAHYLTLRDGRVSRTAHWSSIITDSLRYKADADYEAHFLALFKQSVERRTGKGEPILAQLSGGIDSTSIVCMSDHLRRSADPDAKILDTISYFDDSEASLNERTYFSITEARRGKVGTHIDVAFSQRTFEPHDSSNGAYLIPGADSFSFQQEQRLYDAIWKRGFRSILSGIGGDEVLGGIPIGYPELADYLVSGDISRFLRQSVAWSLVDRSPLLGTLYSTILHWISIYTHSESQAKTIPPWISTHFHNVGKNRGNRTATVRSLLGVAPHRVDNSRAFLSVMETLPHAFPQILFRPEYRYPFLDRDLVDYLFSIPREQVLRPGRRRSLMRRGLVNIVPTEILERRRKAFQLRAPLRMLQQAHPMLETLFMNSAAASAGFIDVDKLRVVLKRIAQGDPEWWQELLRTIALELWLRSSNRENHRISSRTEEVKPSLSLIA